MGLFDRKDSLENHINYLKRSNPILDVELAKKTADIVGEEMTKMIFSKLAAKEKETLGFESKLAFLTYMCMVIVTDPRSSEQKNVFSMLANLYLQNPSQKLITKDGFVKIANSFSSRNFILEVYNFLNSHESIKEASQENIDTLLGYLEEARQYYVDERALYTSFVDLVNNMDPAKLVYGEAKDIRRVIKSQVAQDKKASGIYDVDQATLREIDRKITKLGILSERLQTLVSTADSSIASLSSSINEQREILTDARIQEIKVLSDEANKIIASFNASYLELLGQQRETVVAERDSLIAEFAREAEKKKTEIIGVGNAVGQQVASEIRRIRTASSDSIERIENYLTTNDEIKQLISNAQENQMFIQSLKALESMGITGMLPITTVKEVVPVAIQSNASTLDSLITPNVIVTPSDSTPEVKVNRYFDRSISFQQRYDELMAKKEELMKEGEIFHDKFDDILVLTIQGDAPYLWGPSGCGKTYMVQPQLSKLLEIPIVKNGYILYEQDVIGYTNSGTGNYVASNFYRCFKYGYPIFYDEIDKGISNATSILTSFISDNDGSTYVFPNGETVKRHPNFRIIAAGNTRGTGRNLTYNTSQKLDESILQRFSSFEIDYDNRIEQRILADYPGWFEFAVNFRKAVGKVPSDSGETVNTVGTFTTRDASFVVKHKNDGSMSDEKLIRVVAIGSKDFEYLSKIEKYLGELDNGGAFKTEKGKTLLKEFKTQVKGMRSR